MSSFMVSNETLRKIAAVLDDIETGKNAHFYNRMNTYGVEQELRAAMATSDSIPDDNYKDLFISLFNMNASALVARYGNNSVDMFEDINEMEIPKKPELVGGVIAFEPLPMDSPVALKKSIDCYLYQCSESEEIENSHLFKACENLRDAIANMIVNQSPAYEAAEES